MSLLVVTAPDPPLDARPRPLGAAAAVVPGVLVHGAGHYAAGEPRTAWRLLAMQGAGLGGFVAGLAGLVVTGASPRLVAPLIVTTAAGAGLFAISGLADLYGVLVPGGVGAAAETVPLVEARLGARYVRNPTSPYSFVTGPAAELRLRRWRLSPSLWGTPDGETLRAEARVARRIAGGAADLDALDVVGGVVHHREGWGAAPFSMTFVEATLAGRVGLARLGRTLHGSFVEGSFGLAMGANRYGGSVDAVEAQELLLARFGYGFFVGRGTAPRAEVLLFYDHRHDDFAGGLKMPGLGSGPLGHFGASLDVMLRERWGVNLEAQAGSAHVFGLALVHRAGRAAP